ncbi:hypothetical protein DYY66_0790 [Candidatus Nitrosotalea sp. FS]|nr:hypothetical protein [Candidatus Nitrosotalea sp. FS]
MTSYRYGLVGVKRLSCFRIQKIEIMVLSQNYDMVARKTGKHKRKADQRAARRKRKK